MSGYRAASVLTEQLDGAHLDLATALGVTPSGPVENPVFCSGFVSRPDVVASGLLAVADIAASRYVDAGLAKRLANLDPVVTAGGDRLRFESFSACNSVYARFDLDREGLGSSEVGFGTTNVDINLPLRTALARTGRAEALHLDVGGTELRVSTPSATHVERKVALPERWIRGLGEVPALSSALQPVTRLAGLTIGRFLGGLPQQGPPGPTLHLVPVATGFRVARVPVPGSLVLPGSARLRGCARVARHASVLTVFSAAVGTTGWVFEVPGGRFTLVLSPHPFRGFSGEGSLLSLLARGSAQADGQLVLASLGWDPVVDPVKLGHRTGLGPDAVAAGLAWLAASGRLGHDLAEQRYFHRELPVDTLKVARRHPRLTEARTLLRTGGVRARQRGWTVRGSHGDYEIDDASPLRCECAWEREHAGTRGPCKHILAVLLSSQSQPQG
jgi:hypothetical protein